jgi:ATP-binding cassette subfamily C protein LapB
MNETAQVREAEEPSLVATTIEREAEIPPGWSIDDQSSAVDDPLLQALLVTAQLLEQPSTPSSMTAGLPLVESRLTPALLPRAAERAGMSARLVRRQIADIDRLRLPCILLLKNRQACVLIDKLDTGRCIVVMPESGRGRREIDATELERLYDNYAFFVLPDVKFDQREREVRSEHKGHWFWSTLFRQWPVYSEVMIAALLINCFALASPLFIMNVYDRVVPNNAIETLWVLAIGALTVFAFDFLLKILRGYFIDSAGRLADIHLASRIFEQVMGIKLAARPASAGAFASHLREFESLRDFFTSASVTALIDLPFVLFFLAIIYMIGGPVALVPAIAVPVVIGVGLLMQIPLNRTVKRTFKEAAQKHGILVETINGLETLKSVGAEGRMQRSWERFVSATAESSNRVRFLSSITVNFAATAANLVTIGVVIFGVYRISEGLMTVGALVACTIIAGRAMAPLGQVAGVLTRYNQAKTSLETLNNVMAMPIERPREARFIHRQTLSGDVEFRSVTFAYPGQKMAALDNVSLKIRQGERVGLIGRIGSGKTTIEKLVLGLFEPNEGAVLMDGIDIRQLDPADLRRNIGCVPQDIFLFHGTLRENITLGAPYVDDTAVLKAARLAGVEDFASRHPLGYDMNVGERGDALSGGQRQAVAIARAMLLQPPVLVLDEPTSSMDNSAENRFKQRLSEELTNQTLILVTHRASLLTLVDRLIVMDGGRVVADGAKEQVLKALAQGQIRGAA